MAHCETKVLLLDAAQKRFAYYGLSKVTMDEIAADVWLSKAALYYYFKTKEEIFKEVIVREIDQYSCEMKKVVAEKSAASEKLSAFVQMRLKIANELQNLKKVSTDYCSDLRTQLGPIMVQYRQNEHQYINSIIELGIASGEFRAVAPEKTASLIQHLIAGLTLRRAKDYHASEQQHQDMDYDEQNALFCDFVLNALAKS
jgi:TetR/AcrR family transcriptional regulator